MRSVLSGAAIALLLASSTLPAQYRSSEKGHRWGIGPGAGPSFTNDDRSTDDVAANFQLFAGAGSAAAQEPPSRSGFWLSFGLGYGWVDLSCAGCGTDPGFGPTLHVRLGGTLSPRLLLGGDLTMYSQESEGVTTTLANVSIVAQYYPKAESRWFAKAGVGYSAIEFVEETAGGDEGSGGSFGLSAGIGYDIDVSDMFPAIGSITPIVDVLYGASRDIELGPTVVRGVGTVLISVGLGLTFH